MILSTAIQKRIVESINGAEVKVIDLTGTSDHFQVTVVSTHFEGKSMIDQHRLVKGLFDKDIASGELHALSLKTYTPSEWAKKGLN
jgi:acid stress-induced BolA-like protein IbaG/YrbA